MVGTGILLGTTCFLAGRHSVQPTISPPSSTAGAARKASDEPAAADTTIGTTTVAASHDGTQTVLTLPAWNEQQWQKLVFQPGTSTRNTALAAMLEKLAATDPDRAMAMAQGQGNLKLRDGLVQAALRGWARTSPTNAANLALVLSDSNERERALATVFAGAVAANPDEAVHLSKFLIQKVPDEARSYGSSLIAALCDAGSFEIAAHMAASGDQQTRSGWMASAYSSWAEFQPDQAAQAASAIKDTELRSEALQGIVGGWAEADPAALVQFVAQLPPDAERGSLLSQSLERWAKHDPEAASAWINKNEVGPDMDQGVAAVATMDSLKPDLAVSWAESVVDPKLRSETLVTVLRNWVTVDLPAAKQYLETTKKLLPEDRQEIDGVIATLSGQPTTQ